MFRIFLLAALSVCALGCAAGGGGQGAPDKGAPDRPDAGGQDAPDTAGQTPPDAGWQELPDTGGLQSPDSGWTDEPTGGTRTTQPSETAGAASWVQFAYAATNASHTTARVPANPVEAWSVTLPGEVAYATPLACGGRVFVTMYGSIAALNQQTGATLWLNPSLNFVKYGTGACFGDLLILPLGEATAQGTFCTAVEAATGTVRWRAQRAATDGTIKLEGNTLYLTDLTGAVTALDAATGAERWRTEAACRSSPAIAAGRLFCARDSTLVALDTATGQTIFEAATRGAMAFSAPAISNGRLFLVGDGLLAHSITDGAELWAAPFTPADRVHLGGTLIETSPAVGVGKVVVIGTSGVQAFDEATGTALWTTPVGYPGMTVVLADGFVVVGGDRLLDLETGEYLWAASDVSEMSVTPAVVDGWLFAQETGTGRVRAYTGTVPGDPVP